MNPESGYHYNIEEEYNSVKKLKFKNKKHELNYRFQMKLVPKELRESAEIQAVVYFIALLECASPGAVEYIWMYVERSLLPGFFDHSDIDLVAKSLALHLWEVTYLSFREDWLKYFWEISVLALPTILSRDSYDFLSDLLIHFKSMDK